MPDLAIIADDLTGALDAAAPFAMRGISAAVALSAGALPKALASGARVVSVSTNSREIEADAATAAVREALAALPQGTPLFKKVDLRLKGNVAAELDAMPHRRSIVIPAIPEFGRVTRSGHIEGFGISEPIDIAARLGRHSGAATIPDASTQADIETALDAPHDLVIGARGLAQAMARRMAPDVRPPELTLPASAAYCVIGSTDPITLAQVARLRAARPDLNHIEAPNGVAPVSAISARLTLLQAKPGADRVDGKAVAAALGASLLRLAPHRDAVLVLSGGATAQAILEILGVEVLDLVGEVLPGLPVARAGGLTVVTKSGGFGEPDALSRILDPYIGAGGMERTHVG